MILYIAQFYDTDNITYGIDISLGVFSSREKAEEYIQSNILNSLDIEKTVLDRYSLLEIEVDIPFEIKSLELPVSYV